MRKLVVWFVILCFCKKSFANEEEEFLLGAGIYDITGPAAQINFMGYARASQTAHGIHQRLRARAFIISKQQKKQPEAIQILTTSSSSTTSSSRSRLGWRKEKEIIEAPLSLNIHQTICFVSIDAGMGSDLLNQRVLARLDELLTVSSNPCHVDNLSISGTHTHSAPAGFLQYALFQVTSLGFSEEVMHTFVEGTAQALKQAYDRMQVGSITAAQGLLFNANINRSPSSYLLNPISEQREYETEGNTDKRMLQLMLSPKETGKQIGMLNWFAVHGTSMNSSNLLLSGDNKGYASYLMEKHFNGNNSLPGKGDFVAAFCSTNFGDVSPNIDGPRCIDTGLPCDFQTSTCNDGESGLCVASGPGKDMFESTEIIGRRQFEYAAQLYDEKATVVRGPVIFRHSFVDMSNLTVSLGPNSTVHTCPAALGYGFAGGTTDGPGDFDFAQGRNTSNPFWNMIGGFLSIPSAEQVECQAPKPILLNTGQATLPYAWDPNTMPISIFQIGQFYILNVPGEFTTMAGRRLRKAVEAILVDAGVKSPLVTIAGLSNSYSHYVTTAEEYKGQRYEAASTLYGPHTLSAYIQEFTRITKDLVAKRPSKSAKAPVDMSKQQISLIPPVQMDSIGLGRIFGSVAYDANDSYQRGKDTVVVSFRSANPRNNQRIEGTFLTVDRLMDDGTYATQYVDADWCTKFIWKGGVSNWGTSFAEIHWKIPADQSQGLYRICHFGTRQTVLGYAEALLLRTPSMLQTNMFGSYAVGLLLSSVEFAIGLSDRLRTFLFDAGSVRLSDFQGCSRTFLVRS